MEIIDLHFLKILEHRVLLYIDNPELSFANNYNCFNVLVIPVLNPIHNLKLVPLFLAVLGLELRASLGI
jgi:hypothetical protein